MNKIINISEAASIAIHSTIAIARNGEKINSTKLAFMIKVSRNHLASVMQILTKNGIITSERGPRGGFLLKKEANKISLLDIYELIEGNIEKYKCVSNCASCPFKKCIFGGLTNKFFLEFKNYLGNTKISDLIQ